MDKEEGKKEESLLAYDWKENNEILFYTDGNDGTPLIRISKEGFFYRGERVEDKEEVYKRFSEWLDGVHLRKNP